MDLSNETISHLLNIDNLTIEHVELIDSRVRVDCCPSVISPSCCPKCGASVSKTKKKHRRLIQDLPLSECAVDLHVQTHQFICTCGRCFMRDLEFAAKGSQQTDRFRDYIYNLSQKQPHTQVAALANISHKTVERICYAKVEKRSVDWSKVNQVGIDEFAFRKGHKDFITTIVNLKTGELLDILEKRDKAFLRSYFNELGKKFCDSVKIFCSDMWGPFQDLAKELFLNALIHIDRFHWFKYMNDVLDNVRKDLRREEKDNPIFKGLKWKLYSRESNLKEASKEQVDKALEASDVLDSCYKLRNSLQSIFDSEVLSFEAAQKEIAAWLEKAKNIKNKHLDKFISLFERKQEEIINYLKTGVTSGVVEGINNALRTVKRYTFNMSNFENFKKRVFAYLDS